MKRKLISVLAAALCLLAFSPRCSAADTSARAAIVYEPRSATVLYEKNAQARLLIASTTKILTALVVLENCGLGESVEVTGAHAAVEGSSMYLRPGEDYTVEQLLYGLMLASGNDAAAALAEHCAGSMEAFAELMNGKCAELGLENSHFVNSHGLDAPGQYSSAADLALITAAAMEDPDFCRIFSTASHRVKGVEYQNHNKLLRICPGCIGGKTGYTEKAGRILVSCAEREGMRLICVTISDPRDWEDHMALYERCFGAYRFVPLPELDLQVISGTRERAELDTGAGGFVCPKDARTRLSIQLPDFVFAPLRQGELLGQARLIGEDGSSGAPLDIRCGSSVPLDESQRAGALDKIKRLLDLTGGCGVYYLER